MSTTALLKFPYILGQVVDIAAITLDLSKTVVFLFHLCPKPYASHTNSPQQTISFANFGVTVIPTLILAFTHNGYALSARSRGSLHIYVINIWTINHLRRKWS